MFSNLNKTEPSLSKQSYIFFAGKITAFLIQLLIPVFFVRLLTQQEYGFYQLSMVTCQTFVPVLSLGLVASLYYFYPNAKTKKSQLIAQTVTMHFIIGSLFLIIFLVFFSQIDALYSPESSQFISAPTALLTFFLLLSILIEHIFILEKKAILNAVYLVFEQLIKFILVFLTVLYFRTAYHAIWALVVYAVIRTLFLLCYLFKKYKGPRMVFDFNYIKDQFKYSLPIGMGLFVGQIGKKLDRFIVTSIAGINNLAIYSIASFSIPYLQMFYTSIFQIAMPKLSLYGANGEKSPARALWHKLIVKAALLTIPSVIFFEIMAEPFVRVVFSEQYVDGTWPYRILLLTLIVQMTGYGLIARAFKKTRIYFKANVALLVVSMVLGVIFTKYYGIIGASISAFAAFSVHCGYILHVEKKILNLTLAQLFPYRELFSIFSISALCSLPLFFSLMFLQDIPDIIELLLCFITYAVLVGFFYHSKAYISINTNYFKHFFLKAKT